MNNIAAKLRERHWRAGTETNDEARVRRQREREEGAAEIERLTAENEKLRAALEPFANMGKAMMGRKHHNEAVVQYELAPTIKVFHLVRAHEARAATPQETRDE